MCHRVVFGRSSDLRASSLGFAIDLETRKKEEGAMPWLARNSDGPPAHSSFATRVKAGRCGSTLYAMSSTTARPQIRSLM